MKESSFEKPVEIVEATPENAREIIEITKQCWLDTYVNEKEGITREDVLSRDWDSPPRIEREEQAIAGGEHGNRKYWVAKEGDRVIGFCAAAKEDSYGEIAKIYLLSEFRGAGIGRQLMESAIDWLGREHEIRLQVVKYNPAVQFYKKLGFKEGEDITGQGNPLPTGKVLPRIEMVLKGREQ